MNQPIKKFRSDIRYFAPKLFLFGALVSFPIMIAGLFAYLGLMDISLNTISNTMALLWVILSCSFSFLYLMTFIFPVYIYRHGIKCYDYYGFYKEVEWDHIQVAYFESVGGIEYVFLDVEGLSTPVTIPLYLEGMDEFIRLVREYDRDGELAAYFGR